MSLADAVRAAWETRATMGPHTRGEARDAVDAALEGLDSGSLRVAEKVDGRWIVHQWLKQAVLLSFRLNAMRPIGGGFDKVPLKYADWDEARFTQAGFRAVPGAVVRRGAYVAPGAILMPCFVNIGARVGEGTMIDTWATVGSCAQIGAGVHLSGGAGIGGVLEPLQATPTIIEDGAVIGRGQLWPRSRVQRGRAGIVARTGWRTVAGVRDHREDG